MTNKLLLSTLAAAVLLVSCSQRERSKRPYQRFASMSTQSNDPTFSALPGAFALDTKTGQLCQTYPSVESSSSAAGPAPKTAEEYLKSLNAKSASPGWHNLPQCKQLYEQAPD
jgi:hypothetical protein